MFLAFRPFGHRDGAPDAEGSGPPRKEPRDQGSRHLQMPPLLAIDQNPVWTNATIGGKDDWAVTETFCRLDEFGDVDFAFHSDPFLIVVSVQVSPRLSSG